MKEFLKKLKEYLPLVTILPLILGGLWQILALASISPSYLRFFSVSQQIADGLVILFLFTAIGSLVYFFIRIYYSSSTSIQYWATESYGELIAKIAACLIILSGIAVTIYFRNTLFQKEIQNGIPLGLLIFIIMFVLVAFGMIWRLGIYIAAIWVKLG